VTFADLRRLNRACTFSSGHKAVLFALSTYMDGAGRARPGRKTLVADCGLSDNRVRACLRDLVDAGFVVVTEEDVGTVYTLQKLPEKVGCPQPEVGCPQPEVGCPQPEVGCPQPVLLYKGKTQEDPKKRDSAGAQVETFSEEGAEGRADLVAYRGSKQPLARLAWAERTAKFHIEALGLAEADAAKLRGEWQAFLVGRAERARANQANMLQVDQAAGRLREILKGGGVACAVEAVQFAIANGLCWPVPKPSRNGVSGAKVSGFGGELMRSYEGTAKTTATAEQLKGFGL
jgi:hypothetical protein